MAFGKNTRIDSRRSSSSCCSTATTAVFVALCLVAVWMLTSSDVIPLYGPGTKSVVESEDVSEDATRMGSSIIIDDAQEETKSDSAAEQVMTEKATKNQILEAQEANSRKASGDAEHDSDDASQTQMYHDNNGHEEGQDLSKDGEQVDTQGKDVEHSSNETGVNEQSSNESTDNDEQQAENGNESDGGEKPENEQEQNSNKQEQSENEIKSESGEESEGLQDKSGQGLGEENIEEKQNTETQQSSAENRMDNQTEGNTIEVFPDGAHSEILNETNSQNGVWSTQSMESKNEKEAQKSPLNGQTAKIKWKICKTNAGPDYIPCLDNEEAIKKLTSTKHYEHRERHCPEESPTCLVPLPEGYRQPIKWPKSRDKIWYFNVPHTKLAAVKGHQNWVKVTGEYLTFPGGGTQFKHGALHYIDFIQETLPDIAWGKRTRVILDVGCGVASFGGYLFERDVLAMSFAPKDEHEAQVQFALERGIPAISAVMGTNRLPFPSGIFDIVHCARCRVPWHIEGGKLLLELNRLLRPGGYFVWSATPVYQSLPVDVGIWKAMSKLTESICWKLVKIKNDTLNGVGAAIYRKPSSNECYEKREEDSPPLCRESDDPDAVWNVPLQACMHKVPLNPAKRGSHWPEQWPKRLEATPYWLDSSQAGVYGKPAPEDFRADYEHWKHVVEKSYLKGMGINWSNVRNVMDMRSIYGGFAAALREMKVWVMNVVPVDSPDTLPIIYERGLFGIYHDWCESFSTYPRTYDLLHADHLFSTLNKRCKMLSVIAEVDRILRPEGHLIVRDDVETISEVQNMAKSLQWEVRLAYTKENEGLLCVQKTMWRPQEGGASDQAS